jgi:hypothetical protein
VSRPGSWRAIRWRQGLSGLDENAIGKVIGIDLGRRWHMSKVDELTCPRCGSADLELERADVNGETADETTLQRCRQCGARFSITAKRD